jgi:hypothetical protein
VIEINDINRYNHFLTSKLFSSLFYPTSGACMYTRTNARSLTTRIRKECMKKRERKFIFCSTFTCRQHHRTAVTILLTDNHQTWCLDQLATGIFSKLQSHISIYIISHIIKPVRLDKLEGRVAYGLSVN